VGGETGTITHTTQQVTDAIKRKARELGFTKVGIARAEELTDEGERLREWLSRGFHATMEWMARTVEKRIDPRAIVPDARSVVCVAMNYYTDVAHSDDPEVGKISRYAWGDDYHIIMTKRLEQLQQAVRELEPSARTKLYVDTGPMMDKAWAARAGIGWLGKHTNIITTDFGSWVFLGEIITDLALVYDDPIADHCGTCRACIDACPTGALDEPYVLDSTKCISYWTIEHRGEIPASLAAQFEHWVYGCDICQDVCPWNSFQQPTPEDAFMPRPWNVAPRLDEVASLSKEEFQARVRRSPIKRTKHEGLTRNARVVMQNSNRVEKQ
jgi:epoxyqueuosine reductase